MQAVVLILFSVGLTALVDAYWEWKHSGDMGFALFIAGVFFTTADAVYLSI